MDLFSLVARLTLDRSDYEKGIGEAEGEAQTFASKLRNGLGTAAKVGTAAVAAISTATVAMGSALVSNAGQVAAYGDNIDKMSQKLGLSAEAYQEWDAIMQHSGTSIESMTAGMKTLVNAAASGAEEFQAIGLSQEQVASMSQEDLFAATITGLQNMEDESQRTVLATKLLGRSAMELGPLLNTSAADTEAMRKRVHDLGGVMSKEAVKAAAAYQDSLQDMTTAYDGLKRNLVSKFLPGITTVMDGLADVFSGEDGVGKIGEGIDSIVTKITDELPRIMDTGSRIVLALSQAIVKNLPKLIETASDTLMMFAQGIIEQLPALVEAGLQILVSLAQAIADNLPTLIPTIVDVVLKIVDILTQPSTLSNLIDAALQIMIALARGLIKAVPTLIEKAPAIIMNLVWALIENAPKLLEAGAEMLHQIVKSIASWWDKITAKGKEIVKWLWDGIKANAKDIYNKVVNWIDENIVQPIRNAYEAVKQAGKALIDNFWDGIANGWKDKESWFWSLIESLPGGHTLRGMRGMYINAEEQNGIASNAMPGYEYSDGQEYTVPRDTASADRPMYMVLDGEVFARLISGYMDGETQRRGVKLSTGGAL